jgi:hypothetical protein
VAVVLNTLLRKEHCLLDKRIMLHIGVSHLKSYQYCWICMSKGYFVLSHS